GVLRLYEAILQPRRGRHADDILRRMSAGALPQQPIYCGDISLFHGPISLLVAPKSDATRTGEPGLGDHSHFIGDDAPSLQTIGRSASGGGNRSAFCAIAQEGRTGGENAQRGYKKRG